MTSQLFGLPREILSLIYEYDSTYKKTFTENVLNMVWESAIKRSIRMYSIPLSSHFNCCCDDDIVNKSDEIMEGTLAVKFALSDTFDRMSLYKGKNFDIDFYPWEFNATCIKLAEFIFDEKIDDYYKRYYLHISLKIREYEIFDGFVYNNFEENDPYDNDSTMITNYDSETKTMICVGLAD